MTPWPCSTCAAPGFRNLGARGYCLAHYFAPVRTFKPENLPEIGLMAPDGAAQGDGFWWCRCLVCGATNLDTPGEACPWCIDRVNRRWDEQRELTLTAPDVDPDDVRYDGAMRAWAGRLDRAVESELITDSQAANAWRRALRRATKEQHPA